MTRGGPRRNKPTALKVLTGNPGKAPINESEPTAPILDDLTPPTWLDAMAKRCWRDVAPVLQKSGLLTEADAVNFALFCQAYSRYRATMRALRGITPDHENYRQVVITLEKAEASMRLMAADFGMSPASRSRLSVGKPQEDADPMEEILNGRRRTG